MREDPRPSRWKSPWLWIGLSCGVLALFALVLVVLMGSGMFWAYKSSREAILRRNEPILMAAERIATQDPDVTVVSRDPKQQTVTLRNRKTGESFLLGQLEGNKLRIQTPAGEVVPEFAGPHALVSDLEHQNQSPRLLLGSAASPPPAWMPAGPGAPPVPLYTLEMNGVLSGCSVAIPSGTVEEMYASYRDQLTRQGFQVLPARGSVSASSPDLRSSFFAALDKAALDSGKDRQRVMLVWSEMAGNP